MSELMNQPDQAEAAQTGQTAPATKHARFAREVVEAATSRRPGKPWRSAVKCIGRPGRKRCGQPVRVRQVAGKHVEWSCPSCGAREVIADFAGTEADLSRHIARGKTHLWGFDATERDLLLAETDGIPELRAVIARAEPDVDEEGLFLVRAKVDELDDMYTLVEQLLDLTRSMRRIEILEGLRATLCTSIDGF